MPALSLRCFSSTRPRCTPLCDWDTADDTLFWLAVVDDEDDDDVKEGVILRRATELGTPMA